MLSSTLLTLGLVPLTFATPQYGAESCPSPGTHDHRPPSSSLVGSDYALFPDVHPYAYDWPAAGKVTDYPIHFCNTSETAQIRHGLREAALLAAHARDHIHRWGNASSFYTKYFGAAGTAEPAGWFDKIVSADKGGVVFRCDDPDGNCAGNATWAGHWRGENGTDETVICPPSYSERWRLDAMCMHGWTVSGSPYTQFWASDLHHRLFHTSKVGEGVVDHYADDYGPSLRLARDNPELAVRNSHSLALFALDVWAFDVAAPNQGCTGEYVPDEGDEATSVSSSSMAVTTSSAAAAVEATAEAATTTVKGAETSTTSAEEHCHTHDDGEVHCT